MDAHLKKKHDALLSHLKSLGSVAVAFSGGVDSTLLAKVAHDALGNRMLAVTAQLAVVPTRELSAAERFCAEQGIRHLEVAYDVFSVPGFAENPPERCYLCKTAVFSAIEAAAAERGIERVVDGSNTDDTDDYRPGMKALRELGVGSPLLECGFTKADVRALSAELELPTWNAPSAACLASRVPYAERITPEKLMRIEAAENCLRDLGFGQLRVRAHGNKGELARVEVEDGEVGRLMEVREQVARELKALGFTYAAVDLQGFRSGSMNEVLGG